MKNFRYLVITRILLITLTIFILLYFYFQSQITLTTVLFLILVYQIFQLIKYVDTTNREIVKFLQGINYSDFSQSTSIAKLGKSFQELSDEMKKVMNKFHKTRTEREESIKYLQTVVEHVGIGLITFNSLGDIELFNRAAKKILKTIPVKNILSLEKYAEGFGKFLYELKPGEKNTFRFIDRGENIQLLAYATEFIMKNQNLKLVAFNNIQPELEEKEIEAWQKLIRVLTHEIMNSITPISSLASTVNHLLKKSNSHGTITVESAEDITQAINTIQRRSEGLINFVNKYRDISKIPKPNFKPIKLSELFYRIRLLSDSALSGNNINFSVSLNPDNISIVADTDLLEQVILNLINNSIHSLNGQEFPEIKLTADINERGRTIIRIYDNGKGISADIIDKIFIPFFSTKTEGSGIGLSISQSIVRAHGGSIWVESKPGEETTFTLVL